MMFVCFRFLMCTFRASCYSTHLSWAHTPVINWVVCLGQKVSSNPVSEREDGVVALYLPIGPLKTLPLANDAETALSGPVV